MNVVLRPSLSAGKYFAFIYSSNICWAATLHQTQSLLTGWGEKKGGASGMVPPWPLAGPLGQPSLCRWAEYARCMMASSHSLAPALSTRGQQARTGVAARVSRADFYWRTAASRCRVGVSCTAEISYLYTQVPPRASIPFRSPQCVKQSSLRYTVPSP